MPTIELFNQGLVSEIDKKAKRGKKRLQGTFKLPDGKEALGELVLKRDKTRLSLTSQSDLPHLSVPYIFGTTHDKKRITCIDCVSFSSSTAYLDENARHHEAEVFPHFVVIGDEHLDPSAAVIRRIQFATEDLPSLFYDFDAFGHVVDSRPVIDSVLAEHRKIRPIETGEWPQIVYFTGKVTVTEIATEIGKLSVHHRPSQNVGGPKGVFIKNQMMVYLEPSSALPFAQAITSMATALRFLSVFAGRFQEVRDIQLELAPEGDQARRVAVHWSHAPSHSSKVEPHPGDVPLDPIRRPDEFTAVLKNWIARDNSWRTPRSRYLSNLEKDNFYDADRLVAAANMFDILPADALPAPTAVPPALAAAQAACLEILRRLPPSPDRDSAISALGRMGKPSLPKKVQHRAQFVVQRCGARFPELDLVMKLAVQCRNHFVHGGVDGFNYKSIEPFIPFLTDALEFVFAASDLIEAGWDATAWDAEPRGDRHPIARFRANYNVALAQLKAATV